MTAVGRAYLKILPSLTGLYRTVVKEVRDVERAAPPVRLRVEFQFTELLRDIRFVVREIERQRIMLPANVDTRLAALEVERFRREESGRDIGLRVSLDRSLGDTVRSLGSLDQAVTRTTTGVSGLGASIGALGQVGQGFTRSTASITRHSAAVGTSTLRYAALAAAAGQMVTVLSGLGGAAVAASGSLLLLPAAGLAAAAALAVLRLGTSGMSEAFAAADPAAFAEAIAKMPPEMQATARAAREIQTEFGQLRLDVQGRLFAGLGREVSALGALHLPAVRTGLGEMADALNSSARGFASWGREARTVSDVGLILDNSARSMSALSGGVAPVLSGLRDIAAVGSDFLPALSEGLAEGATSFGAFIANARQTGELAGWISGGLSALGELATLLGNIVRIIGAVFAAANTGGVSLLGNLNALTGSLAAFLSTGAGSVALQQIFSGLQAVTSAFLPLLTAVGDAIVRYVAPAIEQLGPVVGVAFGILASAAAPAGQILAALAPLAGVAAQALASLLVPALTAVSGIAAELAPAVAELVSEVVGGGIGEAIRTLTPSLLELARAAAPLIVQFGQLLVQALRIAAPALASLLRVLTPVAAAIGGTLLDALAAALPLVGQLAEIWAQVMLAGLQAALPVLPVVVEVVRQLAGVLSTGLATATPHLVELGRLLGETLLIALQGLLPILPQLAQAWMTLWSEGLLPNYPLLLRLAVEVLPALIQMITAVVPLVVQAAGVLATWGGMIAVLTARFQDDLFPVLRFLLYDVVIPIFGSVVSTVSGALRLLQGIVSVAMGILSGDWSRAWSGLRDIVSGAFALIRGAADLATGGLITLIGSLPGRLLGALGDLGGLLTEAGRNLIRGLIRGIESMLSAVKAKLTQLTNLLPSWKGPPARDRILLRDNGVLIMRGLVAGFEREEPRVRRYLSDLTGAIPAQVATPAATGTAITTGAQSAAPGASAGNGTAELSVFLDAVTRLANRPIVVQVDSTEIARATADGARVLARR
ncbi:hypothetical protein [Lentzea sp. NBRC 102530]|uniref:hypothetical protein n=1 Tax=Lentzea sp. NBRC 102530 TaxID=3032201 RepID=UPI0024A37138|nr:hypothetical protein [Lentzea sp. NBRC 102530]GLY51294.1 hypothetical protein Lesp01_49500 [Lentzea sp. NBRC 102530]